MTIAPIGFALLLAFPFLAIHYFVVRKADKKLQYLLYPVILIKLFVALTMGHYDVYRFIVFIQSFIQNPSLNPWDFSLAHPEADFPYPPVLLYLHSLFFLPFKEVLNITDPLIPSVYGYSLIRIPFLITDLVLLSLLLKEVHHRRISYRSFFVFYLFNSVILFHQYYSGQLDLIAVVPFLFALLRYKNKGADWVFFVGIFVSLVIKPFALIFMPLLVVHSLKNFQLAFRLIITSGLAFILFKISEYPYLFTESYQSLMGKGANNLIEKGPFINFSLFPILYAGIVLLQFLWILKKQSSHSVFEPMVLIMLALAATAMHSAGWMTWLVVFMVYYDPQILKREYILWILWNVCFVFRWLTVPNSPVADSFNVFTSRFLNKDTHLSMGELFHYLNRTFSPDTGQLIANASHILFLLASAILFLCYVHRIFIGDKSQPELENHSSLS